jgi:hypothetical protein
MLVMVLMTINFRIAIKHIEWTYLPWLRNKSAENEPVVVNKHTLKLLAACRQHSIRMK